MFMTEYNTFLYQHVGEIVTLQLNRPEKGNCINVTFCRELERLVKSLVGREDVKVISISAQGNVFSVGGDIADFSANSDNIEALLEDMTCHLHNAISLMSRINVPVIVSVNGVAAGGGLGLVAAADIVIAADSARFVSAYTQSGLVPDTALSYYLPRHIGQRRAAEMILCNRMLTAKEALDWGLVNCVVPVEKLKTVSDQYAQKFVAGSATACGAAKRLVNLSFSNNLEEQMSLEARAMIDAGTSEDGREGVSAFLNKQDPIFDKPKVWIAE